MGVIKQGILGGFSGKVAGVVGSSWKGIAVIKAKPLSVANPRTAAQVAQREKFSSIVALASAMLAGIVKPLWDRFAQQESGYNAFLRANIDVFLGTVFHAPAAFKISQGKMAATPIQDLILPEGVNNVQIPFNNDSGEGLKLATDKVYAVLLDSDGNLISTSSAVSTRADEFVILNFNTQTTAGQVFYAYVAFRRADGTVVSDTTYITLTIA